ncbi:hypothetical protein NQ314_008731 [Rhamnusium bicolor]|uniref:Uncharacterized protein n=1 Tax=Rhamnusium bicolor TaxID=1586634 RepID=A0AAV8Y653_9CUCU|nr:hypothetical protein NQ314_008731 [Rhamnusium bicolor]
MFEYGLHVALNILHNCSSKKIIEVLSDNEIYLQPNQVKVLFDKDQTLFKFYLEHYKNTSGILYNEEIIFKYVALKNPNFLLNLVEEEKIKICSLGRRRSKKIINLVKSDIAKNIELYTSFFKM